MSPIIVFTAAAAFAGGGMAKNAGRAAAVGQKVK